MRWSQTHPSRRHPPAGLAALALAVVLATGCGTAPDGVTPHPAPGSPVGQTTVLLDDVPAVDGASVSRPAGG